MVHVVGERGDVAHADRDAGVEVHEVDPAELLLAGGERRVDLAGLTCVGVDEDPADGVRHRPAAVVVEVDRADARPFRREPLGGRPADPRCRARDQRDLAVECSHARRP